MSHNPPLPDEIATPVRGERMVFTENSGARLVFDHYIQPKGGFSAAHVHEAQEERYEVVSGVATYIIDGVRHTAHPGETVVIKPGTVHCNPWNDHESGLLHLRRVTTPEGGAQLFFVTWFTLLNADRYINHAVLQMSPIQLSVVAVHIGEKTYIHGLPIWGQKIALPALALIGRLIGRKPRYPELEPQYANVPLPPLTE